MCEYHPTQRQHHLRNWPWGPCSGQLQNKRCQAGSFCSAHLFIRVSGACGSGLCREFYISFAHLFCRKTDKGARHLCLTAGLEGYSLRKHWPSPSSARASQFWKYPAATAALTKCADLFTAFSERGSNKQMKHFFFGATSWRDNLVFEGIVWYFWKHSY